MSRRTHGRLTAVALALLFLLALGPGTAIRAADPPSLRLATTTSTYDTGLLQALIPDFQQSCRCLVQIVAVGTGQAIAIGRRGDADVLLVHDRDAEETFLAEGHSKGRAEVMSNDFVVVGPKNDPAGARNALRAADAFRAVAKARAPFASRGDRSGTNTKELRLWKMTGPEPTSADSWYQAVGQGMGETLVFANERGAYTLSDRATWLSMKARLPALDVIVGGNRPSENPDPALLNMYAVMVIDSARHPGVRSELGQKFADWLLSPAIQRRIEAFGIDKYGQTLFYAQAEGVKVTREVAVRVGTKVRTFTVDALRRFPHATLKDYAVLGVKRGSVGTYAFAGASLADVLKAVDPNVAAPSRSGARILVVSRDGWTSTIKWGELFGSLPAGEALYNSKGCNECHGVSGEGSDPSARRPTPALAGRDLQFDAVRDVIRSGGDRHARINPYTPAQLSDDDLKRMLAWLAKPGAAPAAPPAPVPRDRRVILLAYERDGKPLGAADGLIQLVVGADEFAGRYAHWVAAVHVQ